MAARGVRISRDISRDWQETVSDLIDRVVAQDAEIAGLKGALKAAQAGAGGGAGAGPAAGPAAPATPAGGGDAAAAELQAQAARLRRHRDRLAKENAELAAAAAAAHAAADGAAADAASARGALEGERAKARALWQQHTRLLRHHINTAAYAQRLEAELCAARGGGGGGALRAGAAALQLGHLPLAPPPRAGGLELLLPGGVAARGGSTPDADADAPGGAADGPVSPTKLAAAAGGERRAGRFNSRDHPADDQEPLPADAAAAAALLAAPPAPAPLCGGGGGAWGGLHGGGGAGEFHWADDIETCKQQLEALSALFTA
jgi:hypothetical protein